MWDLIVSVSDHCLSTDFSLRYIPKAYVVMRPHITTASKTNRRDVTPIIRRGKQFFCAQLFKASLA